VSSLPGAAIMLLALAITAAAIRIRRADLGDAQKLAAGQPAVLPQGKLTLP
jgi:hypothetical protein